MRESGAHPKRSGGERPTIITGRANGYGSGQVGLASATVGPIAGHYVVAHADNQIGRVPMTGGLTRAVFGHLISRKDGNGCPLVLLSATAILRRANYGLARGIVEVLSCLVTGRSLWW